jgi:protein TonB
VKKVEGAFTARFIVDTTGRIEVASFQVVKRGHPLFIAAVRDVLPLMRFIPAEVAGVKVRQWVERTFPFTLPH